MSELDDDRIWEWLQDLQSRLTRVEEMLKEKEPRDLTDAEREEAFGATTPKHLRGSSAYVGGPLKWDEEPQGLVSPLDGKVWLKSSEDE